MNPDMDRFISKVSHTSDEIALKEQIYGTEGRTFLFHDAHLFFCSPFFHNIIVLQ